MRMVAVRQHAVRERLAILSCVVRDIFGAHRRLLLLLLLLMLLMLLLLRMQQ